MKRVIITGATGCIGAALIRKCISEKIEVVAICHKGSKRISNIEKDSLVTILEADLEQLSSIPIECEKTFDVFYHFGWEGTFGSSRKDYTLQLRNVQFSLDAVKVAKRLGCHTFIGAGSQAEYGRVEGMLNSESKTNPENGYGIAKLCAGLMTRQLCQDMGLRHIWTRILSVYGPGDNEYTMVMNTLRKMLNGEKTCFTKGEQIWDYLYVDDAAEILFQLGEKGKNGHTYCLGSGEPHKLSYYIETMKSLTKSNIPLGLGEIPYSDKQVMHLEADISDIVKDLQYRPSTSFEQGISATIDWINSL